MSSTEFIKQVIDNLVIEFPSIQCRYEYKKSSNIHFIEVLPSSVYNLNDEYAKAETKATLSFIDKFPYEGLCFIADDAIVKLKNPYIVKGSLYDSIPTSTSPENPVDTIPVVSWQSSLNMMSIGVSQNQFLHDIIMEYANMPIYPALAEEQKKPKALIEDNIISDEDKPKFSLAA